MKRSLIKDLTKPAEGARPVYFIAGLAGHVLHYRPLARQLDRQFWVRGILFPVFAGDDVSIADVPDLAERMMEAFHEAPEPIVIVGYSIGGTVAYDMACRLAAQGRRVSVVMIDTSVRHLRMRMIAERSPLRRVEVATKRGVRRLLVTPTVGLKNFATLGRFKRKAWRPELPEAQRFKDESWAASRSYVPPKSDVPIVMIRAVPPWQPDWTRTVYWPEADRGWGAVAPVIAVVPSPGTHVSIAEPKNFDALAAALNQAITTTFDYLDRNRGEVDSQKPD